MSLEPTAPSGPRSRGVSYQDLLDADSREVPDFLREESARVFPPAKVPVARYTSQTFHELEVEKLWKRVWQMACREEDIPKVGDHVLYEIADVSLIIVRSSEHEIRALHNTCLHRGRALRDEDGSVDSFRCPFHGWRWKLDGELAEIPCGWDFPHVDPKAYGLPQAKVGTWGGFVFVNLDPDASSLEAHLGDLPKHFERYPLEERAKKVHVAKILGCNWKVAQEAFMEAYHVVATHPQLLAGIGDANSQYDAWDTFSRALTPNMTPSPHLDWEPSEQEMLDSMSTRSLDAPPSMLVAPGKTARQTLADMARVQLAPLVPDVHQLTDAELADSLYYTLFPNFHPWGAFNRVVYRFRPYRNDVHRCVMEVMYLEPFRGKRPPAAKIHWLREDQDWTQAPELGFLSRVFNQDTFNLPRVQDGLRKASHEEVTFATYQETKVRHFHALLDEHLAR